MSESSVSTLSPDVSSVRYLCRSLWQLPGHRPVCLGQGHELKVKSTIRHSAEANCCNKRAAMSPQTRCSSNVEASLLCHTSSRAPILVARVPLPKQPSGTRPKQLSASVPNPTHWHKIQGLLDNLLPDSPFALTVVLLRHGQRDYAE